MTFSDSDYSRPEHDPRDLAVALLEGHGGGDGCPECVTALALLEGGCGVYGDVSVDTAPFDAAIVSARRQAVAEVGNAYKRGWRHGIPVGAALGVTFTVATLAVILLLAVIP